MAPLRMCLGLYGHMVDLLEVTGFRLQRWDGQGRELMAFKTNLTWLSVVVSQLIGQLIGSTKAGF